MKREGSDNGKLVTMTTRTVELRPKLRKDFGYFTEKKMFATPVARLVAGIYNAFTINYMSYPYFFSAHCSSLTKSPSAFTGRVVCVGGQCMGKYISHESSKQQ